MKKTITLLLTILAVSNTNAQAPAIQWQKSFGGASDEYAYSIQPTNDGGYIIAGYTNSSDGDITASNGSSDFWIVKTNSSGAIQWQKNLGGTGMDNSSDIQQTSDGGYIVSGITDSNNGDVTGNHGNYDIWVVKLSGSGVLQWQKTLGGTGYDYASSIQKTTDGGYIIAGYTGSDDGDVIGNHGVYDFWIVKLDTLGVLQWQKTYGGSNDDQANSIQQTIDGGYIVAGFSNSNDGDVTGNHGNHDYWIVKLDSLGVMQWQKTFGGTGSDKSKSVHSTSDGGYVIAGFTQSNNGDVSGNHGNYDYWIIKLNNVGVLQWQKTLGGLNDDYVSAIQPTFDGGYIIAGGTKSNNGDVTTNHGIVDYWIIKLATEILTTPDFDNNSIVIYPNPVSDKLEIQTPNNTAITKIKITAVNGQVVIEQTQNEYNINVENLTKGIYILEVQSGEDNYLSKFIKK